MSTTVETCPKCEGEGVAGGLNCPECAGTGEVETLQAPARRIPPLGPQVAEAAAAAVNALALPADPVTAALVDVTKTNATITQHLKEARELHERYKGVAFDVRTTKGMEAAKNARLMLRQERYPIQALQKAGSKLLGTMQRQFNARCDEITSEIEGYEAPIDEQITAEETRKEAERNEREAAEARRKEGHIEAIAAIGRMVIEASGLDSGELEKLIASAQQIVVDEGYEEFQGQAQQAKDEALRQLNGMLVAARLEEAELEETRRQQAALREAQEALAAAQREQKEREAAMAAEREAFEREKAELAAQREQQQRALAEHAAEVQRRLDQIAKVMETWSGADKPAAILGRLDAMGEESYAWGERASEAAALIERAKAHLKKAHAAALKREAEEARQQQAARIEELIAGIENLGEDAAEAVKDGSADLVQLRAGLHELASTPVTREIFGDRFGEAAAYKLASTAAINDAIGATIERDRLAAEEAERQQLETRRKQAETRRLVRMQEAAPRMYALILRLTTPMEEDAFVTEITSITEAALAIRKEIEGEQNA